MYNINDFASALTDKYGLSDNDAKLFIREMFGVIAAELRNGEGSSVKLKGLGTFKVSSAGKIVFLPEISLRDRINAPFAQFETVLLNDGADFSALAVTDSEDVEDSSIRVPDVVVPDVPKECDNTCEQTQENANSDKESVGECVECDTACVEDTDNISICVDKACGCSDNSVVRALMEDGKEECNSSDFVSEKMCVKKRYRIWNVLIVSLVLVIAVVVALVVCFHLRANENESRIDKLETQVLKVKKVTLKRNVMAVPKSKSSINDVNDTLEFLASSGVKSPAKDLTSPLKTSVSYDADPRVRTGAYIIVGISKTVIMHNGETMKSLSRQYLGEGMECYVEAVNNYRDVKVGDSVNIPKLKLKPRRR